MDTSLLGRTAVICGSTQGIGLAIAKELALNGASCVLIARDENLLKEIVNALPVQSKQQHSYRLADFFNTAEVKAAIDSIVSSSPIHILINNTGGPKPGAITTATDEDFLRAFTQHLINNQELVQAVLPGMKREGYGRIINITSTSVRMPIANLGVSNTIRAAVAAWGKTLSNEVGQFNITVNTILPGLTETKRLESLIEATAKGRNVDAATISKEMVETIPMKRFGRAAEIANVVAFLASPAASYVNGITIPVDGGRTGTI